jgi:hypothetical protein
MKSAKKDPSTLKKKYIDFDSFQKPFANLLAELKNGRFSSTVLPPVVKPEVLQYTKQVDNVVERAMVTLSKFKVHKDADLAGLIADENHTQLVGVLDGQALLSVVVAHYLCKYDEVFAKARKHFQKIGEDIRLRIMSDTDTFSMPKDDPTQLHLAILQCLNEDTPDAMGHLAVAVQQSSNLFDDKAKLMETAHLFVQEVSGIASSVASGPPALSRGDAVPNARRDEAEENMLTDLPQLQTTTRGARPGKTPQTRPASPLPPVPEMALAPTSEVPSAPVEKKETAPEPAAPEEQAQEAMEATPAPIPVDPAAPEPMSVEPAAQEPKPAHKGLPIQNGDVAPNNPTRGGGKPSLRVDRTPSPPPKHHSPPWSPVADPPPAPPLARPTHNKRLQFYDNARRIGLGAGSSEDDEDQVPVAVSLLPRRKPQENSQHKPQPSAPQQKPIAPVRGFLNPEPMALDGEDDADDFDLLKLANPSTYAAYTPPGAKRAYAPDSDDDMPELDGK